MIVELRRNLQVIIPRQIANDMDLQIGDQFDVVEEDGVIKLIPVVVYTKAEAERLERLASEARTPGHASGSSLASPAPAEEAAVEEPAEPAAPAAPAFGSYGE